LGTDKEHSAVSEQDPRSPERQPDLTESRRKALARLGFAAAVAYTAPTILHLDRAARADAPSCTPPPGGPPNCDPPLTIDGGEDTPAPSE
jgi:hypothetical protein